jgi:signal transduction histidine kinase
MLAITMRDLGTLDSLPDAERQALLAQIAKIPVFNGLQQTVVECLQRAHLIETGEGAVLLQQGTSAEFFWILLAGSIRVESKDAAGELRVLAIHRGTETFGEVSLLAGTPNPASCVAAEPSRLVRLSEDSFWQLMTSCPAVRRNILANMALRMEALQALVLERERLASLGTMAASLMHELNNPGTAAKRACALLRENLERLESLSLENLRAGFNQQELDCLSELKKHVLGSRHQPAMGSMEQADAEEAIAGYLERRGVPDAWKFAATLVAAGFDSTDIACVPDTFRKHVLIHAVNWMEAVVSSMQQLQTLEQSVARVSELVLAVKRYSYEGKFAGKLFDLHESLQSTLIILGYKLRQKQINVVKEFNASVPQMQLKASGLGQVWTNLLDNAIDAAPEGGEIRVRTWTEGEDVLVSIQDNGAGIPEQVRERMFEPFYTSKPVGVGTGLGLSIAFKIVAMNFGGTIQFESEPGRTEFVVRLPRLVASAVRAADAAGPESPGTAASG